MIKGTKNVISHIEEKGGEGGREAREGGRGDGGARWSLVVSLVRILRLKLASRRSSSRTSSSRSTG